MSTTDRQQTIRALRDIGESLEDGYTIGLTGYTIGLTDDVIDSSSLRSVLLEAARLLETNDQQRNRDVWHELYRIRDDIQALADKLAGSWC